VILLDVPPPPSGLFGIGMAELAILGALCCLFAVPLVAVAAFVFLRKKKRSPS
jgi:hypothetical protein